MTAIPGPWPRGWVGADTEPPEVLRAQRQRLPQYAGHLGRIADEAFPRGWLREWIVTTAIPADHKSPSRDGWGVGGSKPFRLGPGA
jgi:hypothetical protein